MRRAFSIITVVCILAAWAVPGSPGGCCGQPDCCKDGLCPMRAHHASAKSESADMDCHSHTPVAAPCAMQSACGHAAQAGLAPVLARGVLHTLAGLQAPLIARRAMLPFSPAALSGNFLKPFHPPRA
jgi:hypothetical protein